MSRGEREKRSREEKSKRVKGRVGMLMGNRIDVIIEYGR